MMFQKKKEKERKNHWGWWGGREFLEIKNSSRKEKCHRKFMILIKKIEK